MLEMTKRCYIEITCFGTHLVKKKRTAKPASSKLHGSNYSCRPCLVKAKWCPSHISFCWKHSRNFGKNHRCQNSFTSFTAPIFRLGMCTIKWLTSENFKKILLTRLKWIMSLQKHFCVLSYHSWMFREKSGKDWWPMRQHEDNTQGNLGYKQLAITQNAISDHSCQHHWKRKKGQIQQVDKESPRVFIIL